MTPLMLLRHPSSSPLSRSRAATPGAVGTVPQTNTAAAPPLAAVRAGGTRRHPVERSHEPHIVAALDWLVRAQDVNATGGIARGFSHVRNKYFRLRGWEPDYPETTGYIIPTLLAAADRFGREDLVSRALLAATWEVGIQLPNGAVQGGVIGEPVSPSAFNTGQVILGWLAAHRRSGEAQYADAATAASYFLMDHLDADGIWRRAHSRFAMPGAALYNTRTAWALAEVSRTLGLRGTRDAAWRALRAASRRQHASGWFPDCCLTDPSQPLLHTVAYAIRGLIEGGRVLEDTRLVAAGASAAAALADQVHADGWLSGRYAAGWRAAAPWACLTGQVQMVSNWIRLFEITREAKWLEPVEPVIDYVKGTQDRFASDPGIAGGIAGSDPLDGAYGSHETLSWATKFFVDALLRHERVLARQPLPDDHPLGLA